MNRVQLNFQGYLMDRAKDELPEAAGVYCVYRAPFWERGQLLFPRELLYIGETFNLKSEINCERRRAEWKSSLGAEENLYYTFAPLDNERERAWAAMVFKHKPVLNRQYKYNFPYEPTQMVLRGQTALLSDLFRVPDDAASQTFSHSASMAEIWEMVQTYGIAS